MEYAYATCLLSESGEEINETNLVAVLEAAGCPVQESRVKAIVAALEDVEVSGVTSVDLDEVGSDPRHNGGPSDQQIESPSGQSPDAGPDSDPTASSELTAIETEPESPNQADDASETTPNAADGEWTGDEFERPESMNPDDEV
jgi:large subunit ribosomal protein L12